jgi:hypothetical protein
MTFTPGQIIRNKKTGKPYLIIFMPETAILVVDLESKDDPVPLRAILPRDIRYYARDLDMDVHTISSVYGYWTEIRNIFMLAHKIRL